MSARSVCSGTRPSISVTDPAHLGATEAAGEADLDALGAAAHRLLNRVLHRPAVGHAAGDLLGDALGDQARIDLRHLDLFDLQVNLLADLLLEQLADALDVRALLADDDARLRRCAA